MARNIRTARTAALGLALLAAATPSLAKEHRIFTPDDNRTLDTTHAPIVTRTDYVFDALSGPNGLAQGEQDRLAGWFDGLGLGYGDTITLDTSAVYHNAQAADAVGAVAADYGMLISHDAAPITAGHPPAGSLRIVVSRSIARVDGCPDWSVGNTPTHNAATPSNFGCAYSSNLAAMIANPRDLVEGHQASRVSDAMLSVKAIQSYRDADVSGKQGLKAVSSKDAGGSK